MAGAAPEQSQELSRVSSSCQPSVAGGCDDLLIGRPKGTENQKTSPFLTVFLG